VDANSCGLLHDAGADLVQALPEGCELGPVERHPARHGIAECEHEPVGGGVEHRSELVGERDLVGGPVGGELDLVLLDEVLGLAAGAVDPFIKMAGPACERGDDVARVEAALCRLQPGNDPALPAPRAGGVGKVGEAAHPLRAGLGAADLEIVGGLVGQCEGCTSLCEDDESDDRAAGVGLMSAATRAGIPCRHELCPSWQVSVRSRGGDSPSRRHFGRCEIRSGNKFSGVLFGCAWRFASRISGRRPLDIRIVAGGTREGRLRNEFVARCHYLGYARLVGARTRYSVRPAAGLSNHIE